MCRQLKTEEFWCLPVLGRNMALWFKVEFTTIIAHAANRLLLEISLSRFSPLEDKLAFRRVNYHLVGQAASGVDTKRSRQSAHDPLEHITFLLEVPQGKFGKTILCTMSIYL